MPLRGKPLNVEKKRIDQVLQNEEFRSIITAIGTGIGEDFDISGLKYDKIIILSDADQDGAHIRAILLTFFYRYMKELITEGHVYMGQPPLYKLQKGTNVQYLYDDAALNKALRNTDFAPTVITVSQRVAAIRNADTIVVLDEGEIVGMGTNDELLRSCEVYKEIFDSQLEKEDA